MKEDDVIQLIGKGRNSYYIKTDNEPTIKVKPCGINTSQGFYFPLKYGIIIVINKASQLTHFIPNLYF
jgi:hypothetical protein